MNHSIGFDSVFGPVHIALASSSLHEIGNHHDNGHSLLPNHSPEAIKGIGQRALGANEGVSLLITVDEVGIDVVQVLLLARSWVQVNAAVIVCILEIQILVYNICLNIFFKVELTGCDVEVTILALVLWVLGVFAGQIIGDAFVLDGLVFPAESNVPIGVQGGHMLGKLIHRNRSSDLIANLDRHFPVHLRGIRVMWWVIQVVVGGVEALSAERSERILSVN